MIRFLKHTLLIMEMNLQILMSIVDEVFRCDETVYWKLKHLPKEKWGNEIISHSARHFSKSAGKLESLCEAYEHGLPFNNEEAKDIVLSAMATLLKTASMLGMNAEDILEGVPQKIGYKGKK